MKSYLFKIAALAVLGVAVYCVANKVKAKRISNY